MGGGGVEGEEKNFWWILNFLQTGNEKNSGKNVC